MIQVVGILVAVGMSMGVTSHMEARFEMEERVTMVTPPIVILIDILTRIYEARSENVVAALLNMVVSIIIHGENVRTAIRYRSIGGVRKVLNSTVVIVPSIDQVVVFRISIGIIGIVLVGVNGMSVIKEVPNVLTLEIGIGVRETRGDVIRVY